MMLPLAVWRTAFWASGTARSYCPPRGNQFPAGRVAVERGFRQRLRDHGLERRRQVGGNARQLGRRRVQGRVQDGDLRGPVKRRLAGEALIDDAGERVDVRASVDVLPFDLLG